MLIAVCVLICLLLLFVLVSFFMTHKIYEFEIDGHKLKVENIAAHLKLYIDNVQVADYFSPQLIKGEEYKLKIGEKDILLKCRSSSLGFKLRLEVWEDETMLDCNNVLLKEKKQKGKEDKPKDKDEGKVIF